MENRFNLVDEPWIPVTGLGKVSLGYIFTEPECPNLAGNPVEKIALMKFLLAIVQAAITPETEQDLQLLGADGLASHCLAYLKKWHHRFYLYGEQPFLQMPKMASAKKQPFGALQLAVATGNTTVFHQSSVQQPLNDADKALLVLTLMSFALGGKKPDNSVVLSPGYQGKSNSKGKPASAKAGPAVAFMGLLHNFYLGTTLKQTLWLNLLSQEQLQGMKIYSEGLGIAPWEQMPEGEDCPTAQCIKNSLMGRLVPLCRFCLLADDGVHYSEGLAHLDYKSGMFDPSVAINTKTKEPKVLWANPEKRPWRELTSILGYFGKKTEAGFQCSQLICGAARVRQLEDFAVWSGGVRVSSNAGEQYLSGTDDFVESQAWLNGNAIGDIWFENLKTEMETLDTLAKILYARVLGYFKEQRCDNKATAAQATNVFWQLSERDFQNLLDHCNDEEHLKRLRRGFAGYVLQLYDQYCPKATARQLVCWAKCRPSLWQYFKKESESKINKKNEHEENH